jgi:hypothetical protein
MSRPYVLARLAGAQPDLLCQAPADSVKHTAMGGVLLTTAAVAGVSAAFALNTAVDLPIMPSVVVGTLWAWVIFNLDRMLVISMVRHSGWVRNVLTAVPRVLLAVVIGAVISVPLVLRIFQPEIDSELQAMRNERFVESQAQLDERFAQIRVLEQQETDLQAVVSGQIRSSVTTDPEVSRLQGAFDAKTAEYLAAERAVVCENDGTCGSGQVGRGPSYREKVEIRDRLKVERDDLRAELDAAIAAARQRLDGSASVEIAAAGAELNRVRDELTRLRAERDGARAAVAAAEENSDGLLARLEALDRLSGARASMTTANLALGLLFVFIELLPVLVKLMSMSGPETHYERLVRQQEADLASAYDTGIELRRQRAALRDGVLMQIDQHRAAAQIEAGKKVNDLLVDKQSEIAQRAIDVWAQIATSRSDAELARWYAQHVGTSGPQPTPPAAPARVTPTPPPGPPGPTQSGSTQSRSTPRGPHTPAAPVPQPIPGPPASASAAAAGPVGGASGYHKFKASPTGMAAPPASGAGMPPNNGHTLGPPGP